MNDLDAIKDLRRTTPEITQAASSAGRERLRGEWTGPDHVRHLELATDRRWYPLRPVTRVVLAGAVGLTVVVGFGVAQNVGDRHDGTPAEISAINAAAFGDQAARAVESTPRALPGPKQWIYVKRQAAQFKGDMNTWWRGMDTNVMDTSEDWERVDGRASASLIDGKLEISAAGWRYDDKGRPMGYKPPGPDMYLVTKGLPTEPSALLRALRDPKTLAMPPDPNAPSSESGPSAPQGPQGPMDDRAVFESIAELLQRPLPSDLRGALYRVLPHIPGVSVQRDIKDAAGRHGLAFANTFEGWNRQMIILDSATYGFLGTYSYAIRDHAVSPGQGTVKKNSVMWLTAQLAQHVVDKPGHRR